MLRNQKCKMKVKVFNFGTSQFDNVEDTVNEWLDMHCPITVHFVTQSESITEEEDGGLTVIV